MSDPRSTIPYRRLNPQGAARAQARAAVASTWMTLWTWLAAIAAAVVILGLVFGYSRSGLVHDSPERSPSSTPATIGSVAPASVPRLGDAHALPAE